MEEDATDRVERLLNGQIRAEPTMELEEAGEIILSQSPLLFCDSCSGQGHIVVTIQDSSSVDVCKVCGGYGHTLNLKYYFACRVVGIEAPKLDYNVFRQKRQSAKNRCVGATYGMSPQKLAEIIASAQDMTENMTAKNLGTNWGDAMNYNVFNIKKVE